MSTTSGDVSALPEKSTVKGQFVVPIFGHVKVPTPRVFRGLSRGAPSGGRGMSRESPRVA
jgi:hypothetical protein